MLSPPLPISPSRLQSERQTRGLNVRNLVGGWVLAEYLLIQVNSSELLLLLLFSQEEGRGQPGLLRAVS